MPPGLYKPSWDEYFMIKAIVSAFRSKDPSTQVGCVIVDGNKHQISSGYNGFVSGIDETKLSWSKDGEYWDSKYPYVVHAEANCILHSPYSVKGCVLYSTLFPCNECAKMICSSGISEVVYLNDKYSSEKSTIASKKLLCLTNIKTRHCPIDKEKVINLFNNYNLL